MTSFSLLSRHHLFSHTHHFLLPCLPHGSHMRTRLPNKSGLLRVQVITIPPRMVRICEHNGFLKRACPLFTPALYAIPPTVSTRCLRLIIFLSDKTHTSLSSFCWNCASANGDSVLRNRYSFSFTMVFQRHPVRWNGCRRAPAALAKTAAFRLSVFLSPLLRKREWEISFSV